MCSAIHLTSSVNDEVLFEESYKRLLPELLAIAPDELTPVNLEISGAVATVLGVVGELRRHRPAIEKHLVGFNLEQFDQLEDYAMALSYANARCAAAAQPVDNLKDIQEEACKLRGLLHNDLSTLIARGFIHNAALNDLRGPNGFKNVASDLQLLAFVAKEHLATITGKCAIEPREIERAFKLASRILRGIGLREQTPALQAEATEMRVRAFTLLTRAYDDARRALTYLRWHEGDVDSIIPSLYAGRSNGRRKAPSEAPEPAQRTALLDAPTNDPLITGTHEARPSDSATVSAHAIAACGPGPFLQ